MNSIQKDESNKGFQHAYLDAEVAYLAGKLGRVFSVISLVIAITYIFDYVFSQRGSTPKAQDLFIYASVITGIQLAINVAFAVYFGILGRTPQRGFSIRPATAITLSSFVIVLTSGILFIQFPSERSLGHLILINTGLSFYMVQRLPFYGLLGLQSLVYLLVTRELYEILPGKAIEALFVFHELYLTTLVILAIGFYLRTSHLRERYRSDRLAAKEKRRAALHLRSAYHSNLAAGLSHQINNPLAIIVGALGLLSRNCNEQAKGYLDKITTATQRISEIIKSMGETNYSLTLLEGRADRSLSAGAILNSLELIFSESLTRAQIEITIDPQADNVMVSKADQYFFLFEVFLGVLIKSMNQVEFQQTKTIHTIAVPEANMISFEVAGSLFREGAYSFQDLQAKHDYPELTLAEGIVEPEILKKVKVQSSSSRTLFIFPL